MSWLVVSRTEKHSAANTVYAMPQAVAWLVGWVKAEADKVITMKTIAFNAYSSPAACCFGFKFCAKLRCLNTLLQQLPDGRELARQIGQGTQICVALNWAVKV